MIYVFDSGPLITLFRHYYRNRFPSLWERFDASVSEGTIISVREVFNEIEGQGDRLSDWARDNSNFFVKPSAAELTFTTKIFAVLHFQTLVRRREQLEGAPVADPFVIAKARELDDGCVVTQETMRPNAAQIPNVCEHFEIPWVTLEGFMEREDWTF